MKRKKDIIEAGFHFSRKGIVVGAFIVAFTLIMTASYPWIEEVETDDGKTEMILIWEGNLAMAAEATPAAGESGFLGIYFVNVSASPGLDYSRNNTGDEFETWATANMVGKTPYANADNFRLEVEHSVSFNIIVRVRFNRTHAYNSTAFIANDTRCEMQVNSSNWADGEDITNATDGVVIESYNNSAQEYIWINFLWDDGDGGDGGGFQIAKNGVITIARIYISANF